MHFKHGGDSKTLQLLESQVLFSKQMDSCSFRLTTSHTRDRDTKFPKRSIIFYKLHIPIGKLILSDRDLVSVGYLVVDLFCSYCFVSGFRGNLC